MSERAKGLACALAMTFLWAIIPILIKTVNRAIGPAELATARIVLAWLTWLLIHAARARPIRDAFQFSKWSWLGGAAMAMHYLFINIGLQHTSAVAANLVVQLSIVFAACLAALFLGEPLTKRSLAGLAMVLLGIGVVMWNGQWPDDLFAAEQFFGNVMIALGALWWGFYGLAQKKLLGETRVLRSLIPIFVIASAVSAAFVPLEISKSFVTEPLSPTRWLTVFALGVVCTGMGYLLLAKAFQFVGMAKTTMTTALVPVLTAVNAWILLGERPSAFVAAGGIVIVSGLLVVFGAPKPQPPTAASAM
jgi:drug/metabolite transporter (DMT)-like permease